MTSGGTRLTEPLARCLGVIDLGNMILATTIVLEENGLAYVSSCRPRQTKFLSFRLDNGRIEIFLPILTRG